MLVCSFVHWFVCLFVWGELELAPPTLLSHLNNPLRLNACCNAQDQQREFLAHQQTDRVAKEQQQKLQRAQAQDEEQQQEQARVRELDKGARGRDHDRDRELELERERERVRVVERELELAVASKDEEHEAQLSEVEASYRCVCGIPLHHAAGIIPW